MVWNLWTAVVLFRIDLNRTIHWMGLMVERTLLSGQLTSAQLLSLAENRKTVVNLESTLSLGKPKPSSLLIALTLSFYPCHRNLDT